MIIVKSQRRSWGVRLRAATSASDFTVCETNSGLSSMLLHSWLQGCNYSEAEQIKWAWCKTICRSQLCFLFKWDMLHVLFFWTISLDCAQIAWLHQRFRDVLNLRINGRFVSVLSQHIKASCVVMEVNPGHCVFFPFPLPQCTYSDCSSAWAAREGEAVTRRATNSSWS